MTTAKLVMGLALGGMVAIALAPVSWVLPIAIAGGASMALVGRQARE